MEWQDVEPEASLRSLASISRRLGLSALLQLAAELEPIVVVSKDARRTIWEHAVSSKLEVGGLLIGGAFGWSPQLDSPSLIEVELAIPGSPIANSGVSLALGTSAWDESRPWIERGKLVVGWYHTHPNLGAFFSGTDRRTQRSHFKQSYSVGLVVDPVRVDVAWFLGPAAVEIDASRCNFDLAADCL